MKFYYISVFSLVFLAVIYVVGTGLLLWFGAWLRKRMQKPWMVIVPLLGLLYIGPVAEELWIAWNFDQHCRKDAGIFVYKTVEVEGFYDDTHSWRADKLAATGFKWMEGRGRANSREVYWRHEWVGKEIRSFQISRPTARYHYRSPHTDTSMANRVDKIERVVIDSESDDVLARETKYRREAPWFFIGLDRPVMLKVIGDRPRFCPTR